MSSHWKGNLDEVELHVGDVLAFRSWSLIDVGSTRFKYYGDDATFRFDGPILSSISYNHLWESKEQTFSCRFKTQHLEMMIPSNPHKHTPGCHYREKKLDVEPSLKAQYISEGYDKYIYELSVLHGAYYSSKYMHTFFPSPSYRTSVMYCTCSLSRTEMKPETFCSCGFYAKKVHSKHDFAGDISGVVRLSGRIIEGTKGYRAEKLEILALFQPTLLSAVPTHIPLGHRRLYRKTICKQLSERYDVPIIPRYKMNYKTPEDTLKY